jgi:hypothetical protein
MSHAGLIGDHYWIINGYADEPPLEEQIKVAKQEILNYKEKQQIAKDTWDNMAWAEEPKLYEFWLYKNMEFYWERVLKTLTETPKEMEEVELPEPTETSDIQLQKGFFVNITGEFPVEDN